MIGKKVYKQRRITQFYESMQILSNLYIWDTIINNAYYWPGNIASGSISGNPGLCIINIQVEANKLHIKAKINDTMGIF